MLSSRYLHLHEALGLGPMWLNRSAYVRRNPDAAPSAAQAVRPAPVLSNNIPAAHSGTTSEHRALKALTAAKPAAPVVEKTTGAPAADAFVAMPSLNADVRPSEIMVIGICPTPEDGLNGQVFSGSVGVLLDNMLAAVGLQPQQVHKTCWIKAAPLLEATPDAAQLEAAAAAMAAERQQSQAKALLFVGQIFQKAAYRQAVDTLAADTPLFIVPHPARLLRQPHLKAAAWTELKKLKALLAADSARS